VKKQWLRLSNISKEQHMRNISSREYPDKIKKLYNLAVAALQAIYSMPKVFLSYVLKQVSEKLMHLTGAMYGVIFG